MEFRCFPLNSPR